MAKPKAIVSFLSIFGADEHLHLSTLLRGSSIIGKQATPSALAS